MAAFGEADNLARPRSAPRDIPQVLAGDGLLPRGPLDSDSRQRARCFLPSTVIGSKPRPWPPSRGADSVLRTPSGHAAQMKAEAVTDMASIAAAVSVRLSADVERLLNSVIIEPRVRLPCRIITAADDAYFLPFQLLFASLRLSHQARVTLIDLGLSDQQRAWCEAHGVERIEIDDRHLVVPRSIPWWQTWNKPVYLRMFSGPVLWLDADCIVTGSLEWLVELLKHRPVITACWAAIHFFGYERGVDCLRNDDRLYERYPVARRLTEYPNAGVCAFDAARDADVLDTWIWMVAQTVERPYLRDWVRWYDQGCLQWALEKREATQIVVQDRKFNDPISVQGPHSVAELAGKIESLAETRVLHFPANNKPYSKLAYDLHLDLARYPESRGDLTLYVLGHERGRLDEIADAPSIRKTFLPTLDRRNDLAESRLFQSGILDECETEYVGLCSQSWNRKYKGFCRGIGELHRLRMSPNVVWAARVASSEWARDSDKWHPGMGAIIDEMARIWEVADVQRASVWSNNFICHRGVVLDLLAHWRSMFASLFDKYGWTPPYSVSGYDGSRHWSYLAERISMLYFTKRADLKIRQIPL